MNKIHAVVLTYNRKELLRRCLEAIQSQTRPCDEILIIDNASQDGTQDMLRGLGLAPRNIYRLAKNVGASGGFNIGFRLGYQRGADFVWMMDDDVLPEPDALQRLLDANETLSDMGLARSYLLSTAYTERGIITNTPNISPLCNTIGYRNWPATLAHGLVPVQQATFVSILVPRKTLDDYGVPFSEMFIWGEDTEYTMRVSRDSPGYMVGESKVIHLRQDLGPININKETNPSRIPLYRHHIRNKIFISRKHKVYPRFLVELFRNGKLATKFLFKREYRKSWTVFSAIIESLYFSPVRQSADVPLVPDDSQKKEPVTGNIRPASELPDA